ncbi:MAG TPA: Glu/Leu/Phe/Val dehydrogenase dimerization domain-containing protein [bacterium]|nr:Glu/Leu/Phe/Val dehydrogenase dimerization domain-containing protein [bacterium]
MQIRTISQPGFEEVITCYDAESGLRSIIAIHSTKLGPALGGIRMLPYLDEKDALKDVMLLAKAMTYKAAVSHLKLGGGKAVILGDPLIRKTNALLKAMGKFVQHLKGRYIAAKDAGITMDDLVEISKETKYVTGLPGSMGGSGDPSPWTALGILEGIRACVKERLGKEQLEGLRIAIQGVGHVGYALAELLYREKTNLVISDTNPALAELAASKFKAAAVSPDEIENADVDIFSPCALGGIINDQSIPRFKCSIIAGGANNQLADEIKHDAALSKKGILYAPDYIINAGGLINIYVRDILKEKDANSWIKPIRPTLLEIFKKAKEEKTGTARAANQFTECLLQEPAGNLHPTP